MKKLFVVAFALGILFGASPAKADTPTPTPSPTPAPTAWPTIHPLTPTETSVYLYLRPTPTLFVIHPEDYVIDIHTDPGNVADLSINIYRTANRDHLIDYALFGVVVIVLCLYLVRFISRSTKDM